MTVEEIKAKKLAWAKAQDDKRAWLAFYKAFLSCQEGIDHLEWIAQKDQPDSLGYLEWFAEKRKKIVAG